MGVKLLTSAGGTVGMVPAATTVSDVTVQVPAQNCTLGIQGPAFSAYASSGVVCNNAAATKMIINTKEFDTNNCFDSSTNYRFQPTVAGYYQVTGYISVGSTTGCYIALYKNNDGANAKRGTQSESSAAQVGYVVTALIPFNGTTDYVELYFYNGSGSTKTTNAGQALTWFQAALVRAA